MHCMLAAILHLSQIEFQETDKASGQLDIANTELVEQGKKGDSLFIGTCNKWM